MPDGSKTSANALLLFAAAKGDIKQAQEALRNGADIDKPDADKETPLMAAAREGRLEMARFLLRNGANPNKKVEECSAMHSAIRFGKNLDIVQALVHAGADLEIKFFGDTMVAIAAESGEIAILKWLVERGADPHAINADTSTSALDKARWSKQKETFKWLSGIGVTSPREPGRTFSRALVRQFGGKTTEHSHGFLTNAKFAGYRAQFHADTKDAGVGIFDLKFAAVELRGLQNGSLYFGAPPKLKRGSIQEIKGIGEKFGFKVWRVGETKSVSDQFVAEFFKTHEGKFRAWNFSERDKLRIGQKSIALFWRGLDFANAIERLGVLKELILESCRAAKPERQLFDTEWILKPLSKATSKGRATQHQFGGNLPTPVACTVCGERTNLMAQIDLSDSALPKTSLAATKLPLFWCLNCLEWDPSFYDISGDIPKPLNPQGEPIPQQKDLAEGEEDLPMRPTALVAVPAGKKAGRKSKLGGEPNWIQSDSTPDCPRCDAPMAFAAQLASDKHIAYSDMGLLYAFVCPECKILATLIQSH